MCDQLKERHFARLISLVSGNQHKTFVLRIKTSFREEYIFLRWILDPEVWIRAFVGVVALCSCA